MNTVLIIFLVALMGISTVKLFTTFPNSDKDTENLGVVTTTYQDHLAKEYKDTDCGLGTKEFVLYTKQDSLCAFGAEKKAQDEVASLIKKK